MTGLTALAADALSRADSLAGSDVIAALEEAEITLASGEYFFPYGTRSVPDGVTTPAYMWHQWPDRQMLFLRYTETDQTSSDMQVVWPDQYAADAIIMDAGKDP